VSRGCTGRFDSEDNATAIFSRQELTGSGLFIEPKWAQFLQSSGVVEALGRPMPNPMASPGIMDGQGERII
jgi:hypothetical protein